MPDGALPFLRGRISATEDYRSPQGGGEAPQLPGQNARAQSRRLRRELDEIARKVAAREAQARDAGASRELIAVRPIAGFDLHPEKLGDRRSDVRVVSQDPQTGIVLLDAKDARFEVLRKKVGDYGDPQKRTPKHGRPRNEPAIAPVASIDLADVDSLAGPRLRLHPPGQGERRWFELACRGGVRRPAAESEASRQQVRRQVQQLGQPMPREYLATELVVFYVRLTVNELRALVGATDCCYEVDLVEPAVRDWLLAEDPPIREIGGFALAPPPADAPIVAILDTGIRTTHPLLQAALLSADSVIPDDPSPEDEHGHGTEMAGAILYGDDLGAAIESGGCSAALLLQSVRFTDPKQPIAQAEARPWWPKVTEDAVLRAEAHGEGRRSFAMATTAEPLVPGA